LRILSDKNEITLEPWQCRAARAALDWSATLLESESGVSRRALTDFERGNRKLQAANASAVLSAFERAGVYFDEKGCVCRRDAGEAPGTIHLEDLNAENDK
jgi:transcriptional regulator with XRE-family HTH domain